MSLAVPTVLATEDDQETRAPRGPHEAGPAAAARASSREALATLCDLLGYPEELAAELEERSFAAGRIWRISR